MPVVNHVGSPRVSFVILSYNYEDHIRTTLRSVLAQTYGDFEIIVVDDASHDGSLESIRAFDDPRIRLIVNPHNLGGSASFNLGVESARGEWIVNLDADDWIAPDKVARQLEVAQRDPSLAIIGTWVHVVDESGQPHPRAGEVEEFVNRSHHLNSVSAWVGQNPLCRSSTMVRRDIYLEIGGSDPLMVRAPDYEFWTRALAQGVRFHLIPERLTYYRLHSKGVTHGDPVGTTLELAYAMIRNLAPLAETRALFDEWASMLIWLAQSTMNGEVGAAEALRLRGMLVRLPNLSDYAAFKTRVASPDADLERIGRLALASSFSTTHEEIEKLMSDIDAYIEARDFWHAQATAWEAEYRSQAGLWSQ